MVEALHQIQFALDPSPLVGALQRHDLMLELNPPNVLLQDLKSMNGTFVNNIRADAPVSLHHGDTISGGKTRIQLVLEDNAVAVAIPQTQTEQKPPLDAFLPPPLQAPPKPGVPTSLFRAPDPTQKVAVRCLRCGVQAANELPRSRAENMTYFCDSCQVALLAKPKLLPGYQVVKELGRGGMGAVYLAVHPVLGRRAIKMILPRAAMSQRIRDMFVREASSQAALDHPHVVRVLDFQETARGIFCMVMEYVEGRNAADLVETSPGGIDPRLAAEIVAQGLEGLAHAHAKGIVHRDIKGANLLVGHDDRGQVAVKLSDFGLAKSYDTFGASGFTKTGDISGTVPYLAPEQILDFRNVKPPADLYSMGATLYHLLTGENAYKFNQQTDPFVTILEEDIVPIAKRKPTTPPSIAAVAERALRKDPSQRYRDANDMRQVLLAAIDSGGGTSRPDRV